MKTNRTNPFFIAAITLAGFAFTATSAFATPYYWDTDSDTAAGAGGVSPVGNWNSGGTTWSTDSTGTVATSAYTTLPADDLFFSAGTDATGSYAVTLGANQDANSLTFEEGAVTLSGNTITLAAGGVTVAAGAGDAIIGSALTASGSRTFDVGTGRALTLNGIVTSTITKTGAGTMTLSGAVLNSLGAWTVNEGTLVLNSALGAANLEVIPGGTVNSGGTVKLGTANRVGNGSKFTINAGGTFDLDGKGDLIGSMIGAGSIINNGATVSLQVNPNGGNETFSGVIGGGSGAMGLIINGSGGTQILTGPNTYTSTTQVRQGILSINSIGNVVVGGPGVASAIGAPTTVANGTIAMGITTGTNPAVLAYTGPAADTDRVINLIGTSGGAIIDQSAVSGLLKFTSNLTATGVGSKTLTLRGSNAGTGEISGAIVDNPTVGTTVSTAASTASTSLVLGSVVGLTATNPISGTGIAGGTTIVSIDAATRTVTLSAAATVASGAVITSAGLVNVTSVNKTGTGTWTLSGNNTYSGTTTGTGGTLLLPKTAVLPGYATAGKVVFSGGTIGALMGDGTTGWTTAEVDTLLANATKTSGTLGIDTSNGDLTQWTPFAGAGNFGTIGLAKLGANTLTLNAANTYTGPTIIKEGTLKLSGSGKLGNVSNNYSGAISLGAGASFVQDAAVTQILSGNITGSGGSVVLNGASSGLLLSGSASTYGSLTMTSIVTVGRLFINNTGALPAAATVAINGGTFVIGAAGTYNAAITAASGVGIAARAAATLTNVTLPGSGSVVFNNDDTVTNLLTISNDQTLTGALTVQVGGDKMTGSTAALGGVTLSGKLTGSGSLVVTSGGNVGNVNGLFASGVLTLSGPNDYTGDTTVNSGVLAVNGTSIGDTGKLVIDGGKVDLTNAETVNTLFFGAASQPSGTYSATSVPAGATITTASFTGSGTLIVATGSSANDYASWAALQVPPVTGGPNGDDDNDGVKNLVEYSLLDGQERGTLTGTSISFAKRGSPYGGDLTYAIESSEDLGIADAWSTVTPTADNASTISYTFTPGTPAKDFFRLKVVQVP